MHYCRRLSQCCPAYVLHPSLCTPAMLIHCCFGYIVLSVSLCSAHKLPCCCPASILVGGAHVMLAPLPTDAMLRWCFPALKLIRSLPADALLTYHYTPYVLLLCLCFAILLMFC
jgi:hypothetical protein